MDIKNEHNILELSNCKRKIGGAYEREMSNEDEHKELQEEEPEGDKIDLIRILEKISPEHLNDFFSEPQGILKFRPTLPSVDELSGKIFDGFLSFRLKDVSKWENKCNVETYPPSHNLERDYDTFLNELQELDEKAILKSTKRSKRRKAKKRAALFSFSGIKKSMGFRGGASGDNNVEPEVPQKGFIGHLEDVENYFINKWKGVDLYQVIDELKPKQVIRAIKNPQFILDKNKPPEDQNNSEDVCGGEWNLIMDHICQIRVRSQIIYLESLKTIDPELDSEYNVELLTQNNFEYDPVKNPDGFKLDDSIHYFHEPKPLTEMEKMKKKMERRMRTAKRTIRRIGNKMSSFKKTIKRKTGQAVKSVSSINLPKMKVSTPSSSRGPKEKR